MKLLDRYKKFYDRYNTTLRFHVEKPKDFISNTIATAVKASGAINNITTTEDYIEVEFEPTYFDPFAPKGFIKIQLTDSDRNTDTVIICRIIPTSFPSYNFYIVTVFLFIWTITSLLFSHNFYSILTAIFGWTMMIIIIHFKLILNQGKLENYIRYILTSTSLLKNKSFA